MGVRASVGVDVGATSIAGGLVGEGGEILVAERVPTHRDGPGTALATLVAVVDRLVSEAGRRRLALDGVGVGLPGIVDVERGVMLGLGCHLPELIGVPFAARLGAGAPVFVDNDVNALALGEWLFGRGRGTRSLAVLALGTGVGGGVILDGVPVRGRAGCGGELGHVPVNFDGRACVCGGRGCLNAYLGGRAIAAEARRRAAGPGGAGLVAMAGGAPGAVTAELVFRAAAAGDALARDLVDEACDALAAGLAAVINGVNPEAVIVTGGVAGSLVPLDAAIRARVARYALATALEGTRLRIVGADKRRNVLGGAALVRYELDRGTRGSPTAPAVETPAREA